MNGAQLCAVVGLGFALCCNGQTAFAQTVDDSARGAARKLGYAGVEAYQAGQYEVAADKLEKSYRVLRVPSLGLWSARALVKLGRWVEASERYREVQRLDVSAGDAAVLRQAQADAASELEALAPEVPNVVIRVEGANPRDVRVFVDERPVSSDLIGEASPANPGSHVVRGKRGADEVEVDISLVPGEEETVFLRFTPRIPAAADSTPQSSASPMPSRASPVSPDTGSTRRTLGWVTLGLGGAGLVLGGVTGGMALARKADIDAHPACHDDVCAEDGGVNDTVDSYNGFRTLSSVAFIAGGVLAGSGLVLVLSAPRTTEPRVSLRVSPHDVAVSGRFW